MAKLTVEQVNAVVNSYLSNRDLPPTQRENRLTIELYRQRYYQKRNAQAINSHTKTRRQLYDELGIDVGNIKSCIIEDETS